MTRVTILQGQRDQVAVQLEKLNDNLREVTSRKNAAMVRVLAPFFKTFPEEVHIDVKLSGVYFTMDHPDYTYRKDLFNLYLKESWSDKEPAYTGMDLSYYTTGTDSQNTWELRRLIYLGQLAAIVRVCSQDMLNKMNEVAKSFEAEYQDIYNQISEARKSERDINNDILKLKREKVQEELVKGGVTFDKDVYIEVKRNYTVRINSIRLEDISKSGKTARAVYVFAHHGVSGSEENVNVVKIVDQVLAHMNNIVSTSELV